MRTIILNPSQQRRAEILARRTAGTLSVGETAELLGISERQVHRLELAYRHDGLASVVHGNQGRTPVNQTDPHLVTRLHELVREGGKYHDVNVCHLQELLERDDELTIGRSTLDRLLKQEGLRPIKRARSGPKRRRRERKSAEGMLLQMDASPHAWLEERGPHLTLLGSIDDATGKPVYLHFQPTEDQAGYLRMLRTIGQTHGLPRSVYHDRHTILRSPKQPSREDELAGRVPQSQVQRLLAELGIEAIAAHSPQAKGRIERLWGTLQDRLIVELRLADITTQAAANAFLPTFCERFIARFAQPPADPTPAWVPLPPDLDLAYYFAAQESRRVRADHCVQWQGKLLQLVVDAQTPNLARGVVSVHVVPEGDVYLYHEQRRLHFTEVPVRAREQKAPSVPSLVRPARATPSSRTDGQRRWLYGRRAVAAR
jgi:transposase